MKKAVAFLAMAGMLLLTGCSGDKNYVGNRNNGKLHSIHCDSLPYEKNRVYFSSIEEANDAGYTNYHKECMGEE